MLYSQAQVDKLLGVPKDDEESEEIQTFRKIESELRKAYHPVTAAEFDGCEIERLLTRLDMIRTKETP
jgi:hypothetical protein